MRYRDIGALRWIRLASHACKGAGTVRVRNVRRFHANCAGGLAPLART